jgi:hypothetical protein
MAGLGPRDFKSDLALSNEKPLLKHWMKLSSENVSSPVMRIAVAVTAIAFTAAA